MLNRKFVNIFLSGLILAFLLGGGGCRKKNVFIEDASAKLSFSTDSVLFDTVFTTVGSATRNFRIVNKNSQRIRITSLTLERGTSSPFFLNVDGEPGKTFSDLEIAANDSMYVFVQVHIDPNGGTTELIESDKVICTTNGNVQSVELEAWGQDAYYHYPTNAIRFSDGSYLPYSKVDTLEASYTRSGNEFTWKNDKPHVITGYLVVDSLQKLRIPAGTEVYLNYKAGIWVYRYGQIRVTGEKNKEVYFQGARRERDYADEPGQWDRIWINEGSDQNLIDYAVIKNAFIGVQAELFDPNSFLGPGKLTITNTRIQNMSMWGLYSLAYKVTGGNNVISNCQDHCLNLMYGGVAEFYHCTFVNNWNKDKPREKACVNLNNYTEQQVLDHAYYFGNCIIDGNKEEELNIDIKSGGAVVPSYTFSSCWIKTALNTGTSHFISVKKENTSLKYENTDQYNFALHSDETRAGGFTDDKAAADASRYPRDINFLPRMTVAAQGITAGAYEKQ